MIFDDSVGRSQTHSGSPTDRFGGEKWFEYLLLDVVIHTHPGIGYRYANIGSGFNFIRFVIVIIEVYGLCFNVYFTAGGHGLPGIDE